MTTDQSPMRTAATEAHGAGQDVNLHDLLRLAVLAVVENGHAADLLEVPGVVEYFGGRVPDETIAGGAAPSSPDQPEPLLCTAPTSADPSPP